MDFSLNFYLIISLIIILFSSPDPVSQKICEKIAEYFPNACLVLINNRQLSMQMTQTSLSVIQYSDGKWKVKDKEK
jgi:hypothetical protein